MGHRKKVRRALIEALGNDENAGIRVEAIDALTRYASDDVLSEYVREATGRDENAYVRMKALQFVGTRK